MNPKFGGSPLLLKMANISPGRKGLISGPGEDDDLDRAIRHQQLTQGFEIMAHGHIDRIPGLRPVQGDGSNAVVG